MKKLILLFLIISIKSNATGWVFHSWSFNTTDSVEAGSIQHIVISSLGSYNGLTECYFSIQKLDKSKTIEVFRENWLIYSDPQNPNRNPDGTVNAYFKIPIDFGSGSFQIYCISVSLGVTPKGSIKVSQTTDILDDIFKSEESSKYYDLSGVECVPIEGLYIKETKGKREKVFITK